MESVTGEIVQSVLETTYTIDHVVEILLRIEHSINTILAIFMVLLVIWFLWTLFSKWLFGGI
jgi:hypothetical protein